MHNDLPATGPLMTQLLIKKHCFTISAFLQGVAAEAAVCVCVCDVGVPHVDGHLNLLLAADPPQDGSSSWVRPKYFHRKENNVKIFQ